MVDIDIIVEDCQCEWWDRHLPAEITKGAVLELVRLLRESEKDAARYRWLRDSTEHHLVARVLAIDPDKRQSLLDGAIDRYNK